MPPSLLTSPTVPLGDSPSPDVVVGSSNSSREATTDGLETPLAAPLATPVATPVAPPLNANQIADWVREHHAPLYRYAFRLAGDSQDAEDLVQQTFLAAYRQGGAVRDRERIGSWLYAVLRNFYLKSRRRKQPVAASIADIDLDQLPGVARPDRWEGRDLQSALDALPDEFKLVVLLFYFEDASYREIADRLQIPIGTVMSRLSRAKAALRGLLLETPSRPHAP